MIILCRRESGYNPRCVTGSYVGLWQITRTRWNSRLVLYQGHRVPWWRVPDNNAHMAIKNMRKRYGSITNAKQHSDRCGWW